MLIKTSPFLGSDRVRSTPWLGPATGLLKTKARIARKHGSWIAVANAADKVRLDSRAGKKDLIHASVVEARHGAAVQSQRPRRDDEVSALQGSVPQQPGRALPFRRRCAPKHIARGCSSQMLAPIS